MKKKLILLVCICAIVYIIFQMIGMYNSKVEVSTIINIEDKIILILEIIAYALVNNSFILIFAIGVIIAISKANFIKYDKNDLKKYEGYYREVIDKYSVAALSYTDSFEVNDITVVSTLMELERKNIIECSDKIKIVNEDLSNLTESEKFVVEAIQKECLNRIDYESFKEQIVLECKNNKLLEDNDKNDEKFPKIVNRILPISFIVIFGSPFIFYVLSKILPVTSKFMSSICIFVVVICVSILLCVLIGKSIYDIVNKKITPYVRTKNAKKLNENLEGLKNYIKDFSNLKEKDKEALTLWKEYLIYSVMFGQNTKVIEEYKSKF